MMFKASIISSCFDFFYLLPTVIHLVKISLSIVSMLKPFFTEFVQCRPNLFVS